MTEKHIVGPRIEINGSAELKEVFENAKHIRYYVALSMRVESREADKYIHREQTIDVPITKERYDELRKALSESKAQEPVLLVEGNLELLLDFKSYN